MKINDMEDRLGETDVTKGKLLKWGFAALGVLIVFFVIGFGFELIGVQKKRIIEPMKENVRREVFENTQSYVFGKRQELSKAYGEWSSADAVKKQVIEQVIKTQFADFPADQINNDTLKRWLTATRGY